MAGLPMRMGLREANQHFSAAMRAVRAGRTILLTDRGRPVAVLKPVRGEHDPDDGRTRLEMAGLLRKATREGRLPAYRPVTLRGAAFGKTLRDERDQG